MSNRLLEIDTELGLIKKRLDALKAAPEPEGDEAVRSASLAERNKEMEDLFLKWDTLQSEREPELKRAQRYADIEAAAKDLARVESGDGARYLGRSGPQFSRQRDPYEGMDLIRAGGIMPTEMVARAHNAIEDAPEHMSDAGRERATQLIEMENRHAPLIARHILMTGSQRYHDEFKEYIQTQGHVMGELVRTAMSLTAGNGGVMIPMTLDPTIILTNSGISGPIRSISTTKTIATDDWNGVTSAGVTAEWLGEGTQAADASPTFVQPTITPRKAAAWVFGSYEMLADSGFASELAGLLADAKVRLEEAAFATGNTGASVPVGIVTAVAAITASIVSSATITSFVAGDVYRVADALRPRDAAQASWIANKRIYSLIRQFDTTGSSAFWANLGMGVPAQLLGQPQYECSTMGSVVTTSANILLAGDFKKYYIVDRVGMSVLYEPMVKSTNANRPTGQAGWFAFWRVGADTVDADAFRLLQLHTTPAFTARA